MDKLSTNRIIKLGVIVDNLEEAYQQYCELFNLDLDKARAPRPKSSVTTPAPVPDGGKTPYVWHRGEYRQARCRTAVIPLEPIYLELIEPYDEESPWSEYRRQHGPGIHFMAFYIDSFEEHVHLMESKGMPAYFKQEKGKERYAYFESSAKLGAILELKEFDKE